MRNWHPFLADTLADMSRAGVRRAVGFLAAAQRSYSSCLQYRENVAAARAALRDNGLGDVDIAYVADWPTDPGFVEANADHVVQALQRLPADLRARARVIFTAHSIPASMAAQYPYERQLRETADAVAAAVRSKLARRDPVDHVLVYQSRSGRPEDPWLGPDVCDYLRQSAAAGAKDPALQGVVLSPIGFLCDHIEVLYDLDVEAADLCRRLSIPMVRASAVNLHPRFADTMANAVLQTIERYESGRPLPLVASVR
jgi:ferrochelatase